MAAPPAPHAPHRLLRATIAAAMAGAVGLAAHVLGGGPLSAPGVVPAALALVGPAWLLAGRERAFVTIAGVQLAGQQLVHAWLELDPVVAHLPPPDDVALYGHVLAALAVAAWLRSGERRVWVAARRAARAFLVRWRWVCARRTTPEVPPPVVVGLPRVFRRPGVVLAHVLVPRGPPRWGRPTCTSAHPNRSPQ